MREASGRSNKVELMALTDTYLLNERLQANSMGTFPKGDKAADLEQALAESKELHVSEDMLKMSSSDSNVPLCKHGELVVG